MPDLTLYFLQASRSIRIAWLLEELGLSYKLETYDREATGLAPTSFKRSCGTLLGKAPVLKDGDLVLQESGAITEYDLFQPPLCALPKNIIAPIEELSIPSDVCASNMTHPTVSSPQTGVNGSRCGNGSTQPKAPSWCTACPRYISDGSMRLLLRKWRQGWWETWVRIWID